MKPIGLKHLPPPLPISPAETSGQKSEHIL